MRVQADTVVTVQYSVTDQEGVVVDDGATPLIYLHGGEDFFPRLQAALDGRQIGDSTTVTLNPDDAFGDHDDELVRVEARDAFPDDVTPGMRFEGVGEDQVPRMYTVTDVSDERVVVDGNHPLAGVRLVFSMTVAALRPATAAETAARTAIPT